MYRFKNALGATIEADCIRVCTPADTVWTYMSKLGNVATAVASISILWALIAKK